MTYSQEYYKQNRTAIIARQTEYHQKNREKYLAYMREYNKKYFASHYIPRPRKVKEPKPKKEPKVPKEKKSSKIPKVKKNTKEPVQRLRMEQGNFVLSFFD